MLLRCVVLLLLAISQLAVTTNGENIDLRRIIRKVRNSDSTDINGCKSFACANQLNLLLRRRSYSSELKKVETQLENNNDDKNAIEEGRGKKGKMKKGYGNIFLILGSMTKATILYFVIYAVTIISTKALILAKAALLVATALALVKSLEYNKTSYEIVKHPHYQHIQTHSSSVDYDHNSGNSGNSDSGYYYGNHRKRRARY